MRFSTEGPAIPDILLEQRDAGRVVFLCGAGVSQPSGMPSFIDLTEYVINFFDPSPYSEIDNAFRPWLKDRNASTNVPLDQIFNLLQLEYGKNEVNAIVTDKLSTFTADKAGYEHDLIKKISASAAGIPQVVTTNFDRLFELNKYGYPVVKHVPPNFPDLNYESNIEGITYLHGRLAEASSDEHSYVLSSADFGRAYLSEGWATNFIRNLLKRYTVVLVGYKAEDPPVRYLLQGLNHDGNYDRGKLFAFDCGPSELIEAKWRDRGVTGIAYKDHKDLWKSFEGWAHRAEHPRKWRISVISMTREDPKTLAAYQRGQVAHVLRTIQGARLFAETTPPPHPEWICVMDANVRSAKQMQGHEGESAIFDPLDAYGLDDDIQTLITDNISQGLYNDNLLEWRVSDESSTEIHRIAGRYEKGLAPLPSRLAHIIKWISKSLDSPVIAWWAIRYNGLHDSLLRQLELQIDNSTSLSKRGRHVWSLIIEYKNSTSDAGKNGEWFTLTKRIISEGWNPGTLRYFRKCATPYLSITSAYGLGKLKPPQETWEKLKINELGNFEVNYINTHNEKIDIPDTALHQILSILEEQLFIASGLLLDIEDNYHKIPTCYPDRDVIGTENIDDVGNITTWFLEVFNRIAEKWPNQAKSYATNWPSTEPYFFRKFKLYALNKAALFTAEEAGNEILLFDNESFWDTKLTRELLYVIVDRWYEFSKNIQVKLFDRVMSGPEKPSYWNNTEFSEFKSRYSARHARYIELQNCNIGKTKSSELAAVIKDIPGWEDSWATSLVIEKGSQLSAFSIDENPQKILIAPDSQVVSIAKADLVYDFNSLIEKRSFYGLIKINPRKALSGLSIAAKAGEYPTQLWSSLINEFPMNSSPRLRRAFLNRILRLPDAVMTCLNYTLAYWIERNFTSILDFNQNLGWAIYDKVVRCILVENLAPKELSGEVYISGNVIPRSRRTFEQARKSSIGLCIHALFHAVPGETQEELSIIPHHIISRLEPIFVAGGTASDYSLSIATSELNWLLHIDPEWTITNIVPFLNFENPAAEPAWSGILSSKRQPSDKLFDIIKPFLIHIFQWMETLSWDREYFTVPAQWLCRNRLLRESSPANVTKSEMRSVIRSMSDYTRSQFIHWLTHFGKTHADGWNLYVIPLIKSDWPRERRFITSLSVRAWISMLSDSGDHFPAVFEVVKNFLAPLQSRDHPYYRFTHDLNHKKPIAIQFPAEMLDFMIKVVPQSLTITPYELPKILDLIAEAKPELTSDIRFIRLIDNIERS